jgi:iron complex transport system ATP-binding protein
VTAVEARGLGVRHGRTQALRDVDVDVPAGCWTALAGPNGAGKSSLLRALAGLVRFDGSLLLGGVDARGLSRRELARIVALVPQEPAIPERMTVREYVLLGRTPHLGALGAVGAADRDACERALARMDLVIYAERAVAQLSGGEHQRAVLARALAQDASLLLLDEATGVLDLRRQHDVLEAVDALRRERGLTVVSAIHDLTLASQYAERILLLARGRTVAWGTPQEVLREDVLARHYAVPVHVSALSGARVVVPLRRGGARA